MQLFQDLDFCPYIDTVVASASEDASVKVWNFTEYVDAENGIVLKGNAGCLSFCSDP